MQSTTVFSVNHTPCTPYHSTSMVPVSSTLSPGKCMHMYIQGGRMMHPANPHGRIHGFTLTCSRIHQVLGPRGPWSADMDAEFGEDIEANTERECMFCSWDGTTHPAQPYGRTHVLGPREIQSYSPWTWVDFAWCNEYGMGSGIFITTSLAAVAYFVGYHACGAPRRVYRWCRAFA